HERHDAPVGRALERGPHDAEDAAAECAPDVELPGPRREVRAGSRDEAPDDTLGRRVDEDAPERPVPAELERDALAGLEHAAQEEARGEPPAECRGGGG